MFNPTEINVTHHAMLRWAERGYMGNNGLIYELSKAEQLDSNTAQYDNDLKSFLRFVETYEKNHGDKTYFFTKWFIFVLVEKELITCISRKPCSQVSKPRELKHMKLKHEKRSRQKRRVY
ncbi:hypothetical protein ABLV18_27400 [Klebsiella sp. CN_Kp114]|uniref:hypothetical protein n=1 Tax=unclassified Klebsiella TaxID=2608929 RepID=UPI0032B57408